MIENNDFISEKLEFDEVNLKKLEKDTSIENDSYDTYGLSLYQNNDVASL